MKKILVAVFFVVLLTTSCQTTPEMVMTTLAEGSTNMGDRWGVIHSATGENTSLMYNITAQDYTYNFSINTFMINGEKNYSYVIMEQAGVMYEEDRWDLYELNVGGELIALENPMVYVLSGTGMGLAISGQISFEVIEKMSTASFVDVMLSNYDDERVRAINTLPVEYQTALLSL